MTANITLVIDITGTAWKIEYLDDMTFSIGLDHCVDIFKITTTTTTATAAIGISGEVWESLLEDGQQLHTACC